MKVEKARGLLTRELERHPWFRGVEIVHSPEYGGPYLQVIIASGFVYYREDIPDTFHGFLIGTAPKWE